MKCSLHNENNPQSMTDLTWLPNKSLKFKNHVCTWHLANFSEDMPKHEQIMIFKDAFSKWGFMNYPLRYESTEIEEEATVKIYFVQDDNNVYLSSEVFKCPYNFDAPENAATIAVAYAPQTMREGQVYVSDKRFFTKKRDNGGIALIQVLMHELGHTHNLKHITYNPDEGPELMNPEYHPTADFGESTRKTLARIYYEHRREALNQPDVKIFIEDILIKPMPEIKPKSLLQRFLEFIC